MIAFDLFRNRWIFISQPPVSCTLERKPYKSLKWSVRGGVQGAIVEMDKEDSFIEFGTQQQF